MSNDTFVLVLLAGVAALVVIFVAAHFLIPATPYTGPVMRAPSSRRSMEVDRKGRLGIVVGHQLHDWYWWAANTAAIEANVAKLLAGVPLEPRLYEQAGTQALVHYIGDNRFRVTSFREPLPSRRYVGPAFVEDKEP